MREERKPLCERDGAGDARRATGGLKIVPTAEEGLGGPLRSEVGASTFSQVRGASAASGMSPSWVMTCT